MSLGSQFRMELDHLARRKISEEISSDDTLGFIVENGIVQMGVNLLPFFQNIFLKCGSRGVLVISRILSDPTESSWAGEHTNLAERQVVAHGKDGSTVLVKHFPASVIAQDKLVNVTGAGDSLVGSLLASLVQNLSTALQSPLALDQIVRRAQKVSLTWFSCVYLLKSCQAAVMTLQSPYAVSPLLSAIET